MREKQMMNTDWKFYNGEPEYLRFDNRMLAGESPELDIEVTAQKQSSYNKLSYNEMAMQFFQMGFFRPELADQAAAALEMMDFKGRDALRRRLGENADLHARLMQAESRLQALQSLLEPHLGPEGLERQPLHRDQPKKQAPRLKTHSYDVIGGELRKNGIAERARARAAAATQPR